MNNPILLLAVFKKIAPIIINRIAANNPIYLLTKLNFNSIGLGVTFKSVLTVKPNLNNPNENITLPIILSPYLYAYIPNKIKAGEVIKPIFVLQ